MSETNDSTFCEDGDHFKIVRKLSKYEELKENKRSASDPTEEIKAHHALRDFERGAAELIERARECIYGMCQNCSARDGDGMETEDCEDCEAKKLLAEMDALVKGGAK